MTKQITSYKELLEEKIRLQALLVEQKKQISEDWEGIKEDLKPSIMIASTIRNIFSRKASSAIATLGINLITDGFVKKVLLSKTGWLTRFIVPSLIKNYASHLIDEPEKLLEKIKHLFSKNGKTDHKSGMDTV